MTSEFCHAAVERSVDETTYLTVSLKNGAPGSSSAVRVDQAGANISQVSRPSRMAELDPVIAPMVAPMPSVKPHGAVQLGSSKTPSKLTNSCTPIVPMTVSLVRVARALARCHECVDRGSAISTWAEESAAVNQRSFLQVAVAGSLAPAGDQRNGRVRHPDRHPGRGLARAAEVARLRVAQEEAGVLARSQQRRGRGATVAGRRAQRPTVRAVVLNCGKALDGAGVRPDVSGAATCRAASRPPRRSPRTPDEATPADRS